MGVVSNNWFDRVSLSSLHRPRPEAVNRLPSSRVWLSIVTYCYHCLYQVMIIMIIIIISCSSSSSSILCITSCLIVSLCLVQAISDKSACRERVGETATTGTCRSDSSFRKGADGVSTNGVTANFMFLTGIV